MIKKALLTIATVIGLAGCAAGFMTQPIKQTIQTAPSAYDANYIAMAKALNSVGSVVNQDKTVGFVNGKTNASVTVQMQLDRDGKLTINTSLAPSLLLYGTTMQDEHDKVINALKPNLK